MKKKAVITGIGVVSPLGIGHQDFWDNLVSGNSAIAPMECLDLSKYACKNGAEVKGLNPEEFLGRKGLRYLKPLRPKNSSGFKPLTSAPFLHAYFDRSRHSIGAIAELPETRLSQKS